MQSYNLSSMFLLLIISFACISLVVVHLKNRYQESGIQGVIQELMPEDVEYPDEYGGDGSWDDDGNEDEFDSCQDDGYDEVDYESQ